MKRLAVAIAFVFAVGIALAFTAGRDSTAASVPDFAVMRLGGGEFDLAALRSSDRPIVRSSDPAVVLGPVV